MGAFPITLSIPWGLFVGPLPGYIPLPARVRQRVLDPIDPDGDVDTVDRHVRAELQRAVDANRGGSALMSLRCESEVRAALETLFAREPRLCPRPEMHDYQLTYPPAIQLERPAHRRAMSDATYQQLAVGALDTAGYYFHFGFCRYRCRYCFHYELKTNAKDATMERYVDAMIVEMKHVAAISPHVDRALYFLGGGTPTQLPTRLLVKFLDALGATFGRPRTTMSTVEAKPITATDDKLRALIDAGFRRINLGVQTLDPALYAFHHHSESLEVAIDAIDRARELGFEYVNIDLMTGPSSGRAAGLGRSPCVRSSGSRGAERWTASSSIRFTMIPGARPTASGTTLGCRASRRRRGPIRRHDG